MTRIQTVHKPGISLLGARTPGLEDAIVGGGGRLISLSAETSGLVVDRHADVAQLNHLLAEHPAIGWIQLPSAGIERYLEPMRAHSERVWTSAKGAFARPVGEHILALTLATLRHLPERSRATSWGIQKGTTLEGRSIVIIGAGGIAQEAVRLFGAFNTRITVVRRKAEAVEGADRTVTTIDLADVLQAPMSSSWPQP